jgi:hypothetical protein
MNLKSRLAKLEAAKAMMEYRKQEIFIVGCGKGCSIKGGDDYCKHEQQRLDVWIAEHNGNEPDMVIRIIGVPGRQQS